MNHVQAHYENLLAEHYSWMFGDYMTKVRENMIFFREHQILPGDNGRAIDLGCGSGFQSVALAELGFRVLSIDFSPSLLRELENRRDNRTINIVQTDLLNFNQYYSHEAPGVITCMGDTLTHLDSLETVATLLQRVGDSLKQGGRFVITYRDMTRELKGLDRFIPVRSDENKIMTAFMEYLPGYVVVHDLVNKKSADGWVLQKSSYKKLRIGVTWLKEHLTTQGMQIEYEGTEKDFTVLIAVKQ